MEHERCKRQSLLAECKKLHSSEPWNTVSDGLVLVLWLTYKNLQRKRCAVINVTSNAELFFRTAFKEANNDGEMPLEWFEKAETVDAPRLRMADAFIEVNVVKISPLDAER